MSAGGVTEMIWHFLGYIHIVDDTARSRLNYEELDGWKQGIRLPFGEAAPENPLHEFAPAQIGPVARPDLLPPPPLDNLDPPPGGLDPVYRFLPVPTLEFPDLDPAATDLQRIQAAAQQIRAEAVVTASYGYDHEARGIDVDQRNFLDDGDAVLSMTGASPKVISDEQAEAEILDMRAQNAELAPELALEAPSAGENGANYATTLYKMIDEDPAGLEMEDGYYVDGELSDEDHDEVREGFASSVKGAFEADGEEDRSDGTSDDSQDGTADQVILAGSNKAINAAEIVEVEEYWASRIVLGDYYQIDGIVQFNSIKDSDSIRVGQASEAVSEASQNILLNSALFSTDDAPAIEYEETARYANKHWDVQIINGDVYDVTEVVQESWIQDGDTVVEQSWGDSYTISGSNETINIVSMLDMLQQYDLVLVGGSYYSINWIYQENILLDDDHIWSADAATGTVEQATIETGENELRNEAMILREGVTEFQPLDSGIETLVDQVSSQSATLDWEQAWRLPSDGTVNVLHITGDVFSINLLYQMNMIADSDSIIQISSYIGGGDVTTSSGFNKLANFASITDIESKSEYQFLKGEVYKQDFLVQSEIEDEEDDVSFEDPRQLVSELVAFLNVEAEEDALEVGTYASVPVADDVVGSMMS